ncbi:putative restriction endonuclease, N6_Mtase domain protein [Cereibacter sphaeroides WS8N]|uniref:N-6 DNA methylase n=1 Tax=Cereibacter sphaeroides TaxID=1063 RepID=UPI00020DFA4A|nr:N-6 DNA methylase [Cereibacter sphaeroides]EGJ22109.1 putative restriction endonuclease, N6_Mtase domain protein [Cereibacter sphaeroides WS8N]
MRNKFTEIGLLTNEASVEDLFVSRLIRDLGYKDEEIAQKASIKQREIHLGSKKSRYSPDYVLSVAARPRVVIDAKAPTENPADWVGQCVSYCATINREFEDENPAKVFIVTNGLRTLVYDVDRSAPELDLSFADFVDGNVKFETLKMKLRPAAVVVPEMDTSEIHRFQRLRIEEVNAVFVWCHQHIYKKDALSQAAGFEEFVKIVFLKLLSDRTIRDRFGPLVNEDQFSVPKSQVKFSTSWIEAREEEHSNPLDALQFQFLTAQLENEIRYHRKKRIFREGARINLHPGTIKEVVRKLQGVYLFGIDADLNGRLFETFLSATMRGKDLGQFFTPRSVAKLGALLADPQVDRARMEFVLDGCCGTGGFLIEVLSDMWAKINANPVLSETEKANLRRRVAETAIYGIDSAQEPNLARLARMNMYLHGDGGSSIYEADFLDKNVTDPVQATAEVRAEVRQFREMLLSHPSGLVDVVLTNPPFAKVYDRKTERENLILAEYELAATEEKLKSSLMFFERYHDLLKIGGRLISVIDDGILSGSSYAEFRNYLRRKFLIRGIVSLPGDAFQRSQARVKTSIVILEKRDPTSEQDQGPAFRYACRYVGVDDPKRQRTLPIDVETRRLAKEEIARVSSLYKDFVAGRSVPPEFVIQADRLLDRLDAKTFEQTSRMVQTWLDQGLNVQPIHELIVPVEPEDAERIDPATFEDDVTYLVVGYDGFAREGETISASEHRSGGNLVAVRAGQIVVSHINAVNGSICVVPEYLAGSVVTSEFTIFEAVPGVDPRLIWAILRSPEIRAEFLIRASGAGRTRVRWNTISNILVPVPQGDLATKVVDDLRRAEAELRAAFELRMEAQRKIEAELLLATDRAIGTLQAFKPPA